MEGKLIAKMNDKVYSHNCIFQELKKRKHNFFHACYKTDIFLENACDYNAIYFLFPYDNQVIRFNFMQLLICKLGYNIEIFKKIKNICLTCSATIDNNNITCITITIS